MDALLLQQLQELKDQNNAAHEQLAVRQAACVDTAREDAAAKRREAAASKRKESAVKEAAATARRSLQLHDKALAMNEENSLLQKQAASLSAAEHNLRGQRAVLCDSLTGLVEALDRASKATVKRIKEVARTKMTAIQGDAMEISCAVKKMSTEYTQVVHDDQFQFCHRL